MPPFGIQGENSSKVATNRQKNSVATIRQKPITFKELWDAYPKNKLVGSATPCNKGDDGPPTFPNQCAVRMGEALKGVGIKFTLKDGLTDCKKGVGANHPRMMHIIRAAELASWLDRKALPGVGKAKKYKPENFFSAIRGKTGIIFFENYYHPTRSGDGGGDHIDLWNEDETTQGSLCLWETPCLSWVPRTWANYDRCNSIWFWEVK